MQITTHARNAEQVDAFSSFMAGLSRWNRSIHKEGIDGKLVQSSTNAFSHPFVTVSELQVCIFNPTFYTTDAPYAPFRWCFYPQLTFLLRFLLASSLLCVRWFERSCRFNYLNHVLFACPLMAFCFGIGVYATFTHTMGYAHSNGFLPLYAASFRIGSLAVVVVCLDLWCRLFFTSIAMADHENVSRFMFTASIMF